MQSPMKHQFRKLLPGYDFTEEQLEKEKFDLHLALHDLEACLSCEGICRTEANKKDRLQHKDDTQIEYINKVDVFFSLHYYDSQDAGRPMFRLFRCPGVLQRKEAIMERLRGAGA